MSAAPAAPSIQLMWDSNAETNLAGYRIYRSTQSGVFPSTPVSGTALLASPTFTDSTVTAGQTYYYVARAVSTTGVESVSSNEVPASVAAAVNLAPTVDAGADRTISLPATTTLIAVGADDGLPTGSSMTYAWTVVTGSGVTLSNPKLATTRATFTAAGVYTLRVKVSDSLLSGTDDVVVTVRVGQPPTVSMTAPSAGSTVTGASVTVSATAADDVAVAGVQFLLDGVNLGAEDTTAPYSTVWSTKSASNGVHSLTAMARDSVGNTTTSSAFSVTVSNGAVALTVSKIGSGSGSVTSKPAGVDCGGTCSVPLGSGLVFALTAVPDAGSLFSGWSGDPDCVDGSVTMIAARACIARFDLPPSNSTSLRGDFDGDGKTDIAVYRPATGEWFLRLSTQNYVMGAGNYHFQWGMPGDVPVVGDFDGDRRTDIAVFRPSSGEWYLLLSSQGYIYQASNSYFQWGLSGDVPLSGDFDGDHKADIAVYRPSTGEWYLRLSTQGYAVASGNWYFQLGTAGDVPVVGDFDGDGKADIGIYRTGTAEWFLGLSSQGYAMGAADSHFQWGLAADQPLTGDFDGDGKTDIAVFRPSTSEWYFRLSTQGYATDSPNLFFQWGLAGDRPIVGDFDGDGKADITAFRPSTGEWFLRESSLGYTYDEVATHFQWGLAGDSPLPR